MATDYNQGRVAEQYREAKARPYRTVVEDYTFLELIGDVTGKTVLDVACGEGHFTRILRKAGARHVVGLDVSERMIELAREAQAREPLGIEYVVQDICSPVPQQGFDVVTAAWLLVYARSRAPEVRGGVHAGRARVRRRPAHRQAAAVGLDAGDRELLPAHRGVRIRAGGGRFRGCGRPSSAVRTHIRHRSRRPLLEGFPRVPADGFIDCTKG